MPTRADAHRAASASYGYSRLVLRPGERGANRPRPARGAGARRFPTLARLESPELPRRLKRPDVRPDPGSEPGEARGTKRGRFYLLGTLHRNPQHVRLKLHEPVVLRCATVDAKRRIAPRGESTRPMTGACAHDLQNFGRGVGHRLERRANEMCPRGSARESDDRSASSRLPVWGSHPYERRNEIYAVRRRDPACQAFALRGSGDDPESIAQPLDGGASNENGCLERVRRSTHLVARNRREQPTATLGAPRAGVEQEKGARAVRVLAGSRGVTALSEERRLLIPGHPHDRNGLAKEGRIRDSELAARRSHPGEQRSRNMKEVTQLVTPRASVDVVEHGARRVGGISRVDGPTGERPYQPAVDCARGKLPTHCAPQYGLLSQHPLELRPREVWIGDESGEPRNAIGLRRKLEAALRRSPVLPYDRATDGLTRLSIPENDRLALVRDPDGIRRRARLRDRLTSGFHGAIEQITRVMLDPPRSRIMLRDLPIPPSDDAPVVGHDETGRAGGALIDGEYGGHEVLSRRRRRGHRRHRREATLI